MCPSHAIAAWLDLDIVYRVLVFALQRAASIVLCGTPTPLFMHMRGCVCVCVSDCLPSRLSATRRGTTRQLRVLLLVVEKQRSARRNSTTSIPLSDILPALLSAQSTRHRGNVYEFMKRIVGLTQTIAGVVSVVPFAVKNRWPD